jgi:hypothetical protein
MAIIASTSDRDTAAGMALFTWTPLTTSDTGAPISTGYSADLTIQVFGTFGGATVTFQGSNNGTNWHPLTQRGGTANMAYTSAANHCCNEMPAFIRPSVTGGTSTSVTVILAMSARYSKTGY